MFIYPLSFYAQYHDLGPTGHLGEWFSQPSLPSPSSAKGLLEFLAWFSQARGEKGHLLPWVLAWIWQAQVTWRNAKGFPFTSIFLAS